MMSRTPPKVLPPDVQMPSGKLCAVTRKKNDIENLLSSADSDREQVIRLYGEFLQKVENLMADCFEIGSSCLDSKTKIQDWLHPHEKNINIFRAKMQVYINESNITKGDKDSNISVRPKEFVYNSQPIEAQARALSPDRVSVASRTSSCRSNSAARIKLAERKAQLSAEKLFQEKLRHVEEEDLKNKMRKKTLELEQQEAETIILESELNKLDDIAHTIENITDSAFPNFDYQEEERCYHNEVTKEKNDYHPFTLVTKSATPQAKFSPRKFIEKKSIPFFPAHSTGDRQAHPRQTNFTQRSSNNRNEPPVNTAIIDTESLATILQKQNEISLRLVKNQEKTDLPKRELRPFDGTDVTQYRRFINNFFLLVHDKCESSADCLHYLEQYTEGNARELVRSAFDSSADVSYENALALLEEEFGNEYKVANTYLEKLENWPPIKSEDSKGLNELSIFLMTCKSNMTTMSVLNQLNSPKQIRSIVMKMPYRLREKWRELTLELIDANCNVDFSQLVIFTRKQSRLLSQPLFGDIKDSQAYQIKRSKVLTTFQENENLQEESEYFVDNKTTNNDYSDNICVFCKHTNHNIQNCIHFSKLNYEQKLENVYKGGLCFSCLKTGHFSKNCNQKLSCQICNKLHPSILHNHLKRPYSPESYQPSPDLLYSQSSPGTFPQSVFHRSYNIYTGAGKVSKVVSPVVPIKIKIQGKDKSVETYAILDNGSSSCFMDHKLMIALGVSGIPTDISLTTMAKNNSKTTTRVVNNLELYSLDNEKKDVIPVVFAQELWPFDKRDLPNPNSIASERHLKDVPIKSIDANIGILIGMNRSEMLKPLEIISGPVNSPYASRHHLGWAVNGPLGCQNVGKHHCHRAVVDQTYLNEIEREIKTMYDSDYIDLYDDNDKISLDDSKWLRIVQESICMRQGHYQINLPFKENIPDLPCNKNQIYYNFLNLKKRLERNEELFREYSNFMTMMRERGYMVKVNGKSNNKWYLNHHGVFHKEKQKIRIVFNCALKYKGKSLNDVLLQGPDFTNNLLGVLLRFREGNIAFTGDIEKMYYQVKVPPHQQDYLRLFWFEQPNLNSRIIEFKLTVHLFGAISSPAICSYALKQTVNKVNICEHIKAVVSDNFYVDDLLCSTEKETVALSILNNTRELLSLSGFKLTQFVSSSRELMNQIPLDLVANSFKTVNLLSESLPSERVLGLEWNTERDLLLPKINVSRKELNRRGILSVIHSIYDPLGLVSPAIIPAKVIFQETCRLRLGWNDDLPEYLLTKWQKWIDELHLLKTFDLPRCIQSANCKRFEVHYFSDGSEKAYGSVAYGRIIDEEKILVSWLLAKSRLTPLNNSALKTVPRIELNAAKLAVILQQTLKKEMRSYVHKEYFWTDSSTVLSYIKNDNKRFQRFVSNRVSFIRSNTSPEQWCFVPSNLNPADVISRGTDINQFVKTSAWVHGPEFLHLPAERWPKEPEKTTIISEDPEIVRTYTTIKSTESSLDKLMLSSSNFYKLKCKVAWMIRFKNFMRGNIKVGSLSLQELKESELLIWEYIQNEVYGEILDILKTKKSMPKKCHLTKLNPFLENKIMRVGGRLEKSNLPYNKVFPIILPSKHTIVKLLIEQTHRQCGHLGREVVLSHLKLKYWIIGANRFVRSVLNECMNCRKLQGRASSQKMAPLPVERVTGDSPPFHCTGIDFFGPYTVTNGRKVEKRYGVIFTCLASRAIHLEMAYSLDTSSFINALRRFIARRGTVSKVKSDNGTNMTSGEKELKAAILSWNKVKVENWMKQRNILWTFNPPSAPHFGGIWEREIRTIKKIMNSVLNEQHMKLADENLNTLLCEIESILNSRPLTQITDDPEDMEPLTPNHLLLKGNFATFPPGLFSATDNYLNRRWKQVQYLADLFWSRWREQYLPLLQTRQRWPENKKSLQVDDLVLVVDNLLPRNQWNTGRITRVFPDSNGDVRVASVKLAIHKHGTSSKFGTQELKRPITKLVLLKSFEKYDC